MPDDEPYEPNHVTAYMQAQERREAELPLLEMARRLREVQQTEALVCIAEQLKRIADHVCGATKTQFGSVVIKGPVP